MTTSEADLRQMLHEARALDYGSARWAAFDAVFRHADAAGNVAFAFRARLRTIEDLHDHGEYARALLAFSSCLSTWDNHPEVTQGSDARMLLWAYKWVIWEVTQFPGVSLDRAAELLDDMRRRYQAGGHSLHAVYQHRGLVAHHMGDLDAAGRWYGEMLAARRDNLSDCKACVPSGHVAYLAAAGRYEDAVRVGAPFANGGCTEQPHWMLSELLLPYLRTGHTGPAVKGHQRAYRRIRDSRKHLELIGLNLEFCGLTGNERYALGIVERHAPWLDRPSSPYAAMEFASAASLALRRLAETGEADALVRRRTDDGTRVWSSTVERTLTEMVALSRRLAAEFDARNGNDYHSRRIEARLSADPLVDNLPLSVLTGRPVEQSPLRKKLDAMVTRVADLVGSGNRRAEAARAQLEFAYALRNAGEWSEATETAEEAQRSLDALGLVAQALEARYLLVELHGRASNADAVLALVDELVAAEQLPAGVPTRGELLERSARFARPADATGRLVRAAELHLTARDHAAEARCLRAIVSGHVGDPPAPIVARLAELTTQGYTAQGYTAQG